MTKKIPLEAGKAIEKFQGSKMSGTIELNFDRGDLRSVSVRQHIKVTTRDWRPTEHKGL